MKRLLSLFIFVASFASCTKAPINGDLEGLWQLTRIESPDTTIATRQYWAFQLHLVQIGNQRFFGRFDHNNGHLRIYDIVIGESYNPANVDKGNQIECLVADSTLHLLAPYGIYRLDTDFTIECLDDEEMRLRSDDVRLHFRKY